MIYSKTPWIFTDQNDSEPDFNMRLTYTTNFDFIIREPINVKVEVFEPIGNDFSIFSKLKNKDLMIDVSFPESLKINEDNGELKGMTYSPTIENLIVNKEENKLEGEIDIMYQHIDSFSPLGYIYDKNGNRSPINLNNVKIQTNYKTDLVNLKTNRNMLLMAIVTLFVAIISLPNDEMNKKLNELYNKIKAKIKIKK